MHGDYDRKIRFNLKENSDLKSLLGDKNVGDVCDFANAKFVVRSKEQSEHVDEVCLVLEKFDANGQTYESKEEKIPEKEKDEPMAYEPKRVLFKVVGPKKKDPGMGSNY